MRLGISISTVERHHSAPTPSLHPMGTKAAATSDTPLSVASKLNWEAAFLVSRTSTRIPRLPICRFVSGLRGRISGPRPSIKRSYYQLARDRHFAAPTAQNHSARPRARDSPGLPQTRPSSPKALLSTSHWPFALTSLFDAPQGLHVNAPPPTRRTPLPSRILTPLFN